MSKRRDTKRAIAGVALIDLSFVKVVLSKQQTITALGKNRKTHQTLPLLELISYNIIDYRIYMFLILLWMYVCVCVKKNIIIKQ